MWNLKKKKVKFIETEGNMVVARGWGMGNIEEIGKRVQTFSYKMNKFWGSNVYHGDYS